MATVLASALGLSDASYYLHILKEIFCNHRESGYTAQFTRTVARRQILPHLVNMMLKTSRKRKAAEEGSQHQSLEDTQACAGQAAKPGTKLTLKFRLHGLAQTAQMPNSPSEGPLARDTRTLQSSAEAPDEQTAACQTRTDEALCTVAGICHAGES